MIFPSFGLFPSFLCLNELIYIFSPRISHCYSMPMLLSSTAFLSLLFLFPPGQLYFHIICSFPYFHINEDTCIKSKPNTNPYLIHFPFRIHFTLKCLCETPLLSDLLAWQEVTWPLCYSHCSTLYPCYLPNKPYSLLILDSFFILASNTGTFLYLS